MRGEHNGGIRRASSGCRVLWVAAGLRIRLLAGVVGVGAGIGGVAAVGIGGPVVVGGGADVGGRGGVERNPPESVEIHLDPGVKVEVRDAIAVTDDVPAGETDGDSRRDVGLPHHPCHGTGVLLAEALLVFQEVDDGAAATTRSRWTVRTEAVGAREVVVNGHDLVVLIVVVGGQIGDEVGDVGVVRDRRVVLVDSGTARRGFGRAQQVRRVVVVNVGVGEGTVLCRMRRG